MSGTPADDDATLVRRIAENRDGRALTELMERHAPKVTGYLSRQFHDQLQHPEIDEAVNTAGLNVWKYAHRFDRAKPFGPWFLMIAHRAALQILDGEKGKPTCGLDFDPPDPVAERPDDEPELSARTTWYMEQLEQIIDHELKGFEQIVARADVAAGGPGAADTELLMKQHKKTKNVVQATRSKVWKKIRDTVQGREALQDRTEVNP